ncbi:MAG: type II methionyl aminopeptidase [Nitrososphaerota archaeon]|nr:type II methionyl aminopeptidase [Nitrososphaerota archaeon]MDG6922709.1 type II methionyl aminopeptidase [Nitrososphaerota archaeon]
MSVTSINRNYLRAGEISREIKREVEMRNWEGKTYVEICEFVEGEIRKRGGQPAFPCNVCANETAAHYTAEVDDPSTVPERALLKIDIGVHMEGYIADTAVTLCYNEELLDMTEATKSALLEALKVVRSGARTSDVGRAVESYAHKRGYLPIANLSGHALEQYVVHAGTSVPNVWSQSPSSFKQDKAYAVEPFFTTQAGSGIVVEGSSKNIYGLVARKNTKDQELNRFLDLVWKKCRSLPFAARWFVEEFEKSKLHEIVPKLIEMKLIRSYPVLVEEKGCPVAQAEHTIAVTPTGFVILT